MWCNCQNDFKKVTFILLSSFCLQNELCRRPSEQWSSNETDEDEQPTKRLHPLPANDQQAINDIITLLGRLLSYNCDAKKEEFNFEFAKLIKNKHVVKPRQLERLHDSSSTNFNFVMLSSKYDNVEALKFLISCGLNVGKKDGHGLTASDYAWANRSSKCLVALLKADAPFPKDFNLQSLETSNYAEPMDISVYDDEIIDFVKKAYKLHKSIELGLLSDVESFVIRNPNIRFAYNEKNQSALTTALIFKQFKIYSFLCNNFFEAGVDSELHKAQRKSLTERAKKALRNKLKNNLRKPVKNHVMTLLSKSRDRSGNKENFKKLIDFYDALDNIPSIRPILKLVAKSDKTDIVFDFNNEDVSGLDPTTDNNPLGLTYHSEGYILIGAGRDETEVLATIAHELAHFAMQLVYSNKCRPFSTESDESKQQIYWAIVEKYRMRHENVICPEIADVFNPDSYHPADIESELIVRVPQLLAFHKSNNFMTTFYRVNYKDLFDFFEISVKQDVERELRMIDQKKHIKEANEMFGVLQKALESDMLSSDCGKEIDFNQSLCIKTSQPELALESIVKIFQKQGTKELEVKYIFLTLEQMLDSKHLEKLVTVAKLEVKPKFFIVDVKKNLIDQQAINVKFLGLLRKLTVFFISPEPIFCFRSHSCIDIDFKWDNLNEKFISAILETKIRFQGSAIALNKIVTNHSFLQNLPLEISLNIATVELQPFDIAFPKMPRVFIKRKYKRYDPNSDGSEREITDETDNLCDKLLHHKAVLIADTAGMGKSTVAAQLVRDLKLKNPASWVAFIDLKQHTGSLIRDHQPHTDLIDSNFFSRKLLKLKSLFEEKLFHHFFEQGKVSFIIDGFDEICPNYRKFVLEIMQAIKFSDNRLLVTTRPHYAAELERELQAETIELMPFTEQDQIEFLTEYFHDKSQNNFSKSTIIDLLRRLRHSSQSIYFYSVPIHIFMLAEVLEHLDLSVDDLELNIYSLYEYYVFMKLDIWSKKGPLAKDDSLKLLLTFPVTNFLQIFHKLALEQVFDNREIAKLSLPEMSEDVIDDMIARSGIVAFGPEEIAQFTHHTYAEHFAADFIFKNTLGKNPQHSTVKLFVATIINEDYRQIRKFMNDRLQVAEEKLETEALANYIEKLINREYVREERFRSLECWVIQGMTEFIEAELEALNLKCDKELVEAVEKWDSEEIRKCVNEKKGDSNETIEIEALVNYVDKSRYREYERNGRFKVLESVVKEEHTYLITLLLKTLDFEKSKKRILVKEILCDAVGSVESLATIFNCIGTFVDENEIKAFQTDLIFHKDDTGKSVLFKAIAENTGFKIECLKFILDYAIEILNEDQFLKFISNEDSGNFWFHGLMKLSLEHFSVVWKAVSFKLGVNNKKLKKLLVERDRNGRTCLHYVCYNDWRVLLHYLQILKQFLNVKEMNELLVAKDNKGELFLNESLVIKLKFETFKKIWEFVETNATEATKMEFVLLENKNGYILLEVLIDRMCRVCDLSTTKYIFDITQCMLKKEGKIIVNFLRERQLLAKFDNLNYWKWLSEEFLRKR